MIVKRRQKQFGFNPLTAFGAFGKGGNFSKMKQAFKAGGFKNQMKGLGQFGTGALKTAGAATLGAGAIGAAALPIAAATSNDGITDV